MTVEAIHLHFNSPLHIGRGATELDKTGAIYHSDALKSALYAVGLPYFPEWETSPDSFFNAFHISSAFPFCGDELFLPKPYFQMQFRFANTAEEKEAKKAKRISFISASLFPEWAQAPEQKVSVQETQVSPGGSYLFNSASKAKAFLHAEIQQRVQVSLEGDTDNDARPFYFDRLYFDENSGLYFLAQFNNKAIRQQVLQVLTILGTQGIGTDRTVGNGLFNFDAATHIAPFDLPGKAGGKLHMSLGLFLPGREELATVNMDESYWQLVKRGGYMGGSSYEKFLSLRKNNIYFFAEGSVFKTDVTPQGRYINLKPDFNDNDLHPVYRCGQPLFITI